MTQQLVEQLVTDQCFIVHNNTTVQGMARMHRDVTEQGSSKEHIDPWVGMGCVPGQPGWQ